MWTAITSDDARLLSRYVDILHLMDEDYQGINLRALQSWVDLWEERPYHYQGEGFEVVLGFRYSPRHEHYGLMGLGFVGTVTPRQALDLVIEKSREFMTEKGVTALYANRPRHVEYAPLEALHDLVTADAHLRVTVEGQDADSILWKLEYRP